MVVVVSAPLSRLLALPLAMPSLRQLLLEYVDADSGTGTRSCSLCNSPYAASSDSTAFKAHLSSKHNDLFRSIMRKAAEAAVPAPQAAAAATEEVESVGSGTRSSSESIASAKSAGKPHKPRPAQTTITTLLQAAGSKRALASLARLFTQSSIAHNVADTPEFKEFLQDVGWTAATPSASAIRASVLAQADSLRMRLVSLLRHTPVTIAADGWTNVRREKITNIVPIANGVAYYWTSIVNTQEKNTARWLYERFLPVFNTLIHTHSLRIVALVVDNEAVNRACFNLLRGDFPFLIHVPCAAHTIQLIVRASLAEPSFAPLVQQLTALIHFFDTKDNRHELKRMQDFRGEPQLAVLKPNDTRWSSTLIALERILRIRSELESCFSAAKLPAIPNKDQFFERLADLQKFLKPFQVATDLLQKDSATLFTVYEQFNVLLIHAKTRGENWAAVQILKRWRKHVNEPATVACAILSFLTPPESLDIQAALDFIVNFGAQYLSFYDGKDGVQAIKDTLLVQIADFNGREGVFAGLEDKKSSMERSGVFNPRKVWLLYPSTVLSRVALALLSIGASEAAVERTFSAQSAVHTKKRNRLHGATVEAELFLKFNSRLLRQDSAAASSGSCDAMDDDFDAEEHGDLFADEELPEVVLSTDDEQEEEQEEAQATAMDADQKEQEEVPQDDCEAAAAAAASANSRRAKRARSVTFSSVPEFIQWFIAEHGITPSFRWNSDARNTLQAAASSRCKGGPSTKELEEQIKAALQ